MIMNVIQETIKLIIHDSINGYSDMCIYIFLLNNGRNNLIDYNNNNKSKMVTKML